LTTIALGGEFFLAFRRFWRSAGLGNLAAGARGWFRCCPMSCCARPSTRRSVSWGTKTWPRRWCGSSIPSMRPTDVVTHALSGLYERYERPLRRG
jgi:hypothetical protein